MKKLTCILLWIVILILGRVGELCAQNTYNVPVSGQNSITTCDAIIYDNGGPLDNYSRNCNGSIVINPGTPNGVLAITSGNFSTERNYDYIIVYSGVGTSGTQLARLESAGSVLTPIVSQDPSGALTILFHSDNSSQRSGFELNVQCVVQMSDNDYTGCSFVWTDQSGYGNYSNNQNVIQRIFSPNGEHLWVSFHQFSLSSGDYLYVYDGNTTSASLIGTYTGVSLPSDIVSSSDCLTFLFTSNSQGVSSGWVASVECTSCPSGSNPKSVRTGSPCAFDNIHPFCTDENGGNYQYASGTTGSANDFFGSGRVACLLSTPAPAWYYMRISNPGNITIRIQQSTDVDFACWGPFNAESQEEFIENLCCGFYDLNIASSQNNTSSSAHYPYGNLVDCSYDPRVYEYCNIPNAQTGEYYLLLITNFSQVAGSINFYATQSSTATTDCAIMAQVSNDGPYCVGDTAHLFCNNPQQGAAYSWSGPDDWSSTSANPVIESVTADMDGNTYALVKTLNGNSSDTAFTTIHVYNPQAHIIAPDTVICQGDSVLLKAEYNADQESYELVWLPGNLHSDSCYVTPSTTTSYILQQSLSRCVAADTVLVHVNLPDVNTDTIIRTIPRDSLPYPYQDQMFPDSGIYTLRYSNMHGCDSSITFVLRLFDTIFVSLDTTVCPDIFPFEWNGVTFHQDSMASVHHIAHNGADSIVNLTVQHYPNPIQSLNMMEEICVGDTLPVSIGISPQSVLMYDENTASIGESQKIFLPDGRSCPPFGDVYRSVANFTHFRPGATMTDVNDILYVRLKIEHSALEDLKMSIVCPNGNRSKLIADYNQTTGSWGSIPNIYFRTNLGLANRLTDSLSCDSTLNPIGEPWNYIWSNNTNHNYQYAAGTYGYCYEPVNIQSYTNPYWDYDYPWENTHESVKPSNPVNMTQIYRPYQSFSNLIGCPLNGQWYIEVQDMLPNDNGYLTEWELAMAPSLLQTVMPSVVTKQLIGPWVTTLTDSTYNIIPPANLMNDTTVSYRFHLQTEAGCLFDTTVNLTVHPRYEMTRDTSVCNSDLPVTWSGFTFNEASTRTLRLQTTHGCDSVITLHLGVRDTSSYTESVESCDTYTWQDDITYSASTDQPIIRLQNAEGCDSVVHLNLTILNSVESVDEVFACDSLVWIDGNTYYESTVEPEHVIVLETGCDSIVHLHLTVGHSVVTDTMAEACGSFTWYEHKDILNSCDNLTHVVTKTDGCDSTVTLHLTIFPLPVACFNFYTLGENYEIETMLHFEECSPNMVNYHWDMGNSDVIENPAFDYAYRSAGTYRVTLRVTDENGCSAEHHRVVVIKNPELQIFVPNSFTPDQNGLNDLFKPVGLHVTDDHYLFVVYDRWGEIMFRTTDPEQGWDGTYKGQLVPPNSVMTWTLQCASDMGMVRKKGTVMVLY